jgi:hypothetical protein
MPNIAGSGVLRISVSDEVYALAARLSSGGKINSYKQQNAAHTG